MDDAIRSDWMNTDGSTTQHRVAADSTTGVKCNGPTVPGANLRVGS